MDSSRDGSRVSDYDYELPSGRIASYPVERRDESRLLVVPAGADPFRDATFRDVVDLLEPGDLLVVNETKVIPARLLGRKPTGAAAEVLLTRPAPSAPNDPYLWEALVRPGRRLKPGATVVIGEDLSVEVVDVAPGGLRIVRLVTDGDVAVALARHGRMPLPPYIERDAESADQERYQTVYARTAGSIAAPTAGLHFTDDLLGRIEEKGVRRTAVTLHVGIGTFRPIEVDEPEAHVMHSEWYSVGEAAARAIAETHEKGGRIWAVGTTTVRTLEAAAAPDGTVVAGSGSTALFIRPPYRFRVVDALITNFHLPRSTLLMLVAALAGHERTMEAYGHAVAHGYRFYSYGDAMAVVGRGSSA